MAEPEAGLELDALLGMPVEVSPFLKGSHRAACCRGTLYVSPAMFDLMSGAHGEELRQLLEAIKVVNLPDFRMEPFQMGRLHG